jgi:hypothetical protein
VALSKDRTIDVPRVLSCCSRFVPSSNAANKMVFPVFYDLSPRWKRRWRKYPEIFGATGNTKNSENEPDYQELTAFPVKIDYWERGNSQVDSEAK